MTRDTWVSSTCLERNVSLSHKQDTSFNIAELLTCLLKLRLHEFEIRKVISSTNNKKKIFCYGLEGPWVCAFSKTYIPSTTHNPVLLGISLGPIFYTKGKLLPPYFCFSVVASRLIFQYFALRSFPTPMIPIPVVPRSVESWWSVTKNVRQQFVYTEGLVRES